MRLRFFFVLLAVTLLVGCRFDDRQIAMEALPSSLDPESVEYARNEAWGFGPGGNETGFNVVILSEEGVQRVSQGGIKWLNAQPGGRVRPEWAETPVPRDDLWLGIENSGSGVSDNPTVVAILYRYGFGFDPPQDHREAIDTALNTPGSYYAYGGGGLVVVVVPQTHRAYVFYAG